MEEKLDSCSTSLQFCLELILLAPLSGLIPASVCISVVDAGTALPMTSASSPEKELSTTIDCSLLYHLS